MRFGKICNMAQQTIHAVRFMFHEITDFRNFGSEICYPPLVHCCYVHVCFVQVTTWGAPNALMRLGAHTFLLLSHLLGSQNKYQ